MSLWYYDKTELKKTPSAIDYDTQLRYRREGINLIMVGAEKLKLSDAVVATSAVYFHRFYMCHSFLTFPQYVTACTCLFLASKIHETPQKLLNVINTYRKLLTETQFKTFGNDPVTKIVSLEKVLLETLQFQLDIEHPSDYLVRFSKCLAASEKQIEAVLVAAQDFAKDSLYTTLSLQWEPHIVAIALLHLAAQLRELDFNDWEGRSTKQLNWWTAFVPEITVELLEDICHQVLDLYSLPSSEHLNLSNVPLSDIVDDKEDGDVEGEKEKATKCYPYTVTLTPSLSNENFSI